MSEPYYRLTESQIRWLRRSLMTMRQEYDRHVDNERENEAFDDAFSALWCLVLEAWYESHPDELNGRAIETLWDDIEE